MDIYEVVGQAVGATAHIRELGALITLCGLPAAGWLAKRMFMPGQSNCDDCLKKYASKRAPARRKK